MTDKSKNHGTPRGENQRIGKDLYNQDKDQQQQRYGYRGSSQKRWDEGNFFHTGPSPRGAQDSDRQQYDNRRGGSGNSSYQQGQNAHLNDHYGSRPDSAYRNERNHLNHGDQGDRRRQSEGNMLGNAGGSRPGNFNEPPRRGEDLHREGPGSRSRYKETDYRYGSGSHNWHRENRYTPNEDRDSNRDDRGFFDKVRDSWNDIMHSDDPEYQERNTRNRHADNLSSHKRFGSEPYQDRQYDNGYDRSRDRGVEGSGSWADETDSGDDDQYRNNDRTQRWRR